MNCKQFEDIIWDYAELKLSSEKNMEAEKHLHSCSSCASMAKNIKNSLAVISSEKTSQVDPYFYSRLQAKMEAANSPKMNHRIGTLKYALAASITIVAIFGGSLFGSFYAEQINTAFNQPIQIEQDDSSEMVLDLADNSFDLTNEF